MIDQVPDPAYVAARRVLLDALQALMPHARSLVLVGAQAVYVRAGAGGFAVAPYTTDADIVLDPTFLASEPLLEAVMRTGGFELETGDGRVEPGIWSAPASGAGLDLRVPVDLIVPEGFAPPGGRRGARLGPHGNRAARRALGLEPALVDNSPHILEALDPADTRSFTIEVAGVAALLVAKAHKLHDRSKAPGAGRLTTKDALDVFRLMQADEAASIGATLAELEEHPIAGKPTTAAVGFLDQLFGRRGRQGIRMIETALGGALTERTITAVCVTYMDSIRELTHSV